MSRLFNGTSDFLSVADDATLDFANTDKISISQWVRPDVLSGNRTFLNKGDAANTSNYSTRIGVNKFNWIIRTTVPSWNIWTSTSTTLFSTGTWSHVLITHTMGTGSSFKLYVDGVDSGGSWTLGTGNDVPAQNSGALVVGRFRSGTDFFDGRIAELAIWKGVTLTADEAVSLGSLPPLRVRPKDRVVDLRIGVASPEPDWSGKKNNATVTGAALADHPPVSPLLFDTWYPDPPPPAGGLTMQPAAAVAIWVANTPTTDPGPVTMSPAAAVATFVANDPATVPGPVTVAAAASVGTWVANDPSISLGAASMAPSSAVGTWVVNDPATVPGPVTTSPGAAAVGSWVVNDPAFALGVVSMPLAAAVGSWVANDPTMSAVGTMSPAAAVGTWVANDPAFALGVATMLPAATFALWVANDPTMILLGGFSAGLEASWNRPDTVRAWERPETVRAWERPETVRTWEIPQ